MDRRRAAGVVRAGDIDPRDLARADQGLHLRPVVQVASGGQRIEGQQGAHRQKAQPAVRAQVRILDQRAAQGPAGLLAAHAVGHHQHLVPAGLGCGGRDFSRECAGPFGEGGNLAAARLADPDHPARQPADVQVLVHQSPKRDGQQQKQQRRRRPHGPGQTEMLRRQGPGYADQTDQEGQDEAEYGSHQGGHGRRHLDHRGLLPRQGHDARAVVVEEGPEGAQQQRRSLLRPDRAHQVEPVQEDVVDLHAFPARVLGGDAPAGADLVQRLQLADVVADAVQRPLAGSVLGPDAVVFLGAGGVVAGHIEDAPPVDPPRSRRHKSS